MTDYRSSSVLHTDYSVLCQYFLFPVPVDHYGVAQI